MLTLALVAATVAAPLSPSSFAAAHAPMVRASQITETTISIALVNRKTPVTLAGDAQRLATDLNSERAKRGIPALTRDAALDRIAYAKGLDMAQHGYFGHTDPAGVTFQDRMRAAHWPTAYVAENIAFDQDEPHANIAFVTSPGHYANMIDPNEHRLGVAVVSAGRDETFYVQVFSGN
jgi:uncharacterized protein YkwD